MYKFLLFTVLWFINLTVGAPSGEYYPYYYSDPDAIVFKEPTNAEYVSQINLRHGENHNESRSDSGGSGGGSNGGDSDSEIKCPSGTVRYGDTCFPGD